METNIALQSFFTTNLVGMAVHTAVRDATGAIIDFRIKIVNKELIRVTGRNDLVGKLFTEEYPAIRKTDLYSTMLRVMETGQPEQIEYNYKNEGFDHYFITMFVKIDDGLIATNLDITKQKKLELETIKNFTLLKQSEELAGVGNWEYDISTKTFLWSDGMYQLFEMPKATPVSSDIYLRHAVEEDRGLAQKLTEGLQKNYQAIELTLRLKPGTAVKTIKIKTTPLRNENGEVEKILGANIDISKSVSAERKIMELHREQAQRNRELASLHSELTTFNRIVSGDYKETLDKLYTIMEFMISNEGKNLSNDARANMRRGQSAIQKMKLMADDILSYSSLRSIDVEKADVNVNDIITTIQDDLIKSHPSVSMHIQKENLPVIKGYPLLLSLLFHHILSNAIKFRKDRTDVFVEIGYSESEVQHTDQAAAEPGTRYTQIRVSDQGAGFDNKDAKKIFNMFFRLHNRNKYKGSGIGLAICKKIMDMHDGFITAEGELNHGATLNCYFPLAMEK